MQITQSRRQFLSTLSFAAAASVVDMTAALAAEGPPEITSVRLPKGPSACVAPSDIAEELLRAEGFTDIRYIDAPFEVYQERIERGEVDFSLNFALDHIISIDRGAPLVLLTGVHVGCIEVFGDEGIRSVTDLKGKSVGVPSFGSPPHMFIVLLAAQVGLDPVDILLRVDSLEDRARHAFRRGGITPDEFVVAGQHAAEVMRPRSVQCAIDDLCATDPARAARRLVDSGFTARYDYVFQALSELSYDKWREYDPEDTLRFYALRLRESGFIQSSPQKIIAEGTDWRFLDALKRELKA